MAQALVLHQRHYQLVLMKTRPCQGCKTQSRAASGQIAPTLYSVPVNTSCLSKKPRYGSFSAAIKRGCISGLCAKPITTVGPAALGDILRGPSSISSLLFSLGRMTAPSKLGPSSAVLLSRLLGCLCLCPSVLSLSCPCPASAVLSQQPHPCFSPHPFTGNNPLKLIRRRIHQTGRAWEQ